MASSQISSKHSYGYLKTLSQDTKDQLKSCVKKTCDEFHIRIILYRLQLDENDENCSSIFFNTSEKIEKDIQEILTSQSPPDNQAKLHAHQIMNRIKQIFVGYNRKEYNNAPKRKDEERPLTPNPLDPSSKREWDNKVKDWRRSLHAHDTPPDKT